MTGTALLAGRCPCGNEITGRSDSARFCLECDARLGDCPHCPSRAASEGLPACSRHLEAELGITYRQLDYWARSGWLRPERRPNTSGADGGSGVWRRWPAAEVEVIRRMGRLTRAGIAARQAAAFARDGWPAGEIAPGIRLEVDGVQAPQEAPGGVHQVRTADPAGHLWGLDSSPVASQAQNCLVRGGMRTVGDLVRRDARDLRDIRGFGPGCLAEVRRVLAAHGLALNGEEPPSGE